MGPASVPLPPPAGAPAPSLAPRLEVVGLGRTYGAVRALDDVSLHVPVGAAHALLGQNGAGKSTLVRLLAGADQPTTGTIRLDGQAVRLTDPEQAARQGVRTIHQHPTLVPTLSVEDNLVLPRPPVRRGLVDRREVRRRAEEVLAVLGLDVDLRAPAGSLRVDTLQRLEIARALARGARLLVLDEPTAVLSGQEASALLATLQEVRARGVSLLYVTHRLEEVAALCSRAHVLRGGRLVEDLPGGCPPPRLARAVAGRDLRPASTDRLPDPGPYPPLVQARGLAVPGRLDPTDLTVRPGEVVGVVGGSPEARSTLLRALAGGEPTARGELAVDGRRVRPGRVADAVRAGLGYVPADRQSAGLVPQATVRDNLAYGADVRRRRVLGRRGSRTEATGPGTGAVPVADRVAQVLDRLQVSPPTPTAPAGSLSGGNQQKLVVGRWLVAGVRVLVLDEPTRGVDVGARETIHQVVHEVAADGGAVVLASSDEQEMTTTCTRRLELAPAAAQPAGDGPSGHGPTQQEDA